MLTSILRKPRFACFAIIVSFIVLSGEALAFGPRVLPPGQLPEDVRLHELKDLDGYFPFTPPTSKEVWAKRAERVRQQILVSQGLWPMPSKTPLNPVIYGRTERDDYVVEKVYFESVPGFFVTGNLYRPRNPKGKMPAVLFAHGHWADARLTESGEQELRQEIATGQERFEQGGRSRFQSMCVQLARMGCIVWQWDMLGNSDANQLSAQLVHGFAKQRPEMNSAENWGLFSPQAEAHLQSVMGLQTLNSIRSLDFLLSLPEVDPDRIAITGASGGGTQTMLLAAIDPRVKLSFPAVMVSTAMQGGCTCENASLLRVDTGNIEFAGLFAPKPQGMTCANDWTKEMSTKGFPELKQLYTFLGAPNNVMLNRGEHFPHNYNAVSRSAFYTWLNRHFKLGFKDPVIERDYEPFTREQLTVWDSEHPQPPAGPDFERQLLHWLTDDAQKQIRAWEQSSEDYQKKMRVALEVIIGRDFSEAGELEWELKKQVDRGDYIVLSGLIKNKTHSEEIPAVILQPRAGKWSAETVVWIDETGKSGLFESMDNVKPEIMKLLSAGKSIIGADLLYQGEFLKDDTTLTTTPKVKNPREAAAYTYGYNYTVFAQRVHDVLSILKFVRTHDARQKQSERLQIVGIGGAGPIVAVARALAPGVANRTVIDTDGFRFGKVLDIRSPSFLPGGAKYDDLPGIIALGAPDELWLAGESGEIAEPIRAAYEKNHEKLHVFTGQSDKIPAEAAEWLTVKTAEEIH